MTPAEIAIVAVAVVCGASVKSITGIGLPPLVIPVLAAFVGVQEAVVIMSIPGVTTNLYLARAYRDGAGEAPRLGTMMVAGALGVPVGVYLLTNLEGPVMGIVIGVTVLMYVGRLLWKPDLRLGETTAHRLAAPVGFAGGALQGATGVSAVVLASYVHALGISPRAFVYTVSMLFQVFALFQVIGFVVVGAYEGGLLATSLLAAALATAVLAVGTRFSVRISPKAFNRLVLTVLVLSATKVLYDSLTAL